MLLWLCEVALSGCKCKAHQFWSLLTQSEKCNAYTVKMNTHFLCAEVKTKKASMLRTVLLCSSIQSIQPPYKIIVMKLMKKEPFSFDTAFVLQQHQGAAQLGVPCALGWRSFQQNNRPCRKYLAFPIRIFCLPPAQHTAACPWWDFFHYQWLSLSS